MRGLIGSLLSQRAPDLATGTWSSRQLPRSRLLVPGTRKNETDGWTDGYMRAL